MPFFLYLLGSHTHDIRVRRLTHQVGHHCPYSSHGFDSIVHLEEVKPFGALHLELEPWLLRCSGVVGLAWAVGDVLDVLLMDTEMNDRDVVVHGRDEIDLEQILVNT